VKLLDTISPVADITQCNFVLVGDVWVWLGQPMERGCLPRLHWFDGEAIFCDARWAFRLGGIFSSEWQARLWCDYHGFQFVGGGLLETIPDFRPARSQGSRRLLRPAEEFRTQVYPSHRARCPDCQGRDQEGRGWLRSVTLGGAS